MHGDALKISIDRGQQASNFYVIALPEYVQRPCAVFPTAPREKDSSLQREFA